MVFQEYYNCSNAIEILTFVVMAMSGGIGILQSLKPDKVPEVSQLVNAGILFEETSERS
jgi:hypothetical protein